MKTIVIDELDRELASELRRKIHQGIVDKKLKPKDKHFIELYRTVKKVLGHTQKEAYLYYEMCKSMEMQYERETGRRLE